jgi:hypothetical protein
MVSSGDPRESGDTSGPGASGSGWSGRLAPTGYEAPRVERVLTPAELEREVLYAGDADSVA